MKSIKKLMLLSGILLSVSAFSFTFQDYKFQSPAVLTTIQENDKFVVNSSNEKINKKINDRIAKEIKLITKENTNTYVKVITNNSKFLSIILENKDSKEVLKYKGLVFEVETGNLLNLSDILAPSYDSALKNLLNDRIAQFGVPPVKNFKEFNSVRSFYLEDEALVLIFDKGRATDDFDGHLFIPLFLQTIAEVLK